MTTAILQTKLYLPQPRTSLVARPRLLTRLQQGKAGKLTLITAPAGFGKTTLAAAWSRQCGQPVAWLALDEDDNEPVRFLLYLVATLESVKPGVGQSVAALLNGPQLPPIESIISVLINVLASTPGSLYLALDDFHLICEPELHRALDFLLEHLPPDVHLIITSRTEPPLALARLRARNELTEVSAADLRFTREEIAAFVESRIALDLPAEDIATLEERTEGWAAALQFVTLSLQNITEREEAHQFIHALSGRDRHVVDYLMTEVFERQPPAIQHFLLQTSILERFCGELCGVLMGWNENNSASPEPAAPTSTPLLSAPLSSQPLLEHLERANLFLISLDNERRWYRYHHLFVDLLRHRLQQQLSSATILELHRRASRWYEHAEWMEEAIHHALAAQEVTRAAQLIERVLHKTLWGQGAVGRVRQWLKQLPFVELRQHPRLLVMGTLVNMMAYDVGQVSAYMSALEELQEFPEDVAGEVAVLKAVILRLCDKIEPALELLLQALAQIPPTALHSRALIHMELAAHHIIAENLTEYEAQNRQLLDLAYNTGNTFMAVIAQSSLGEIAHRQGDLLRARELQHGALSFAMRQGGPLFTPTAWVHIRLANLYQEWNNDDAVVEQLARAQVVAEQADIVGDIQTALLESQAYRCQRQGDLNGMQQAAEQIKIHLQRLKTISGPFNPETVYGWVVNDLALRNGDLTTVGRWLQQRNLTINPLPAKIHSTEHWLWARYEIARSRRDNDPSPLTAVVVYLLHTIGLADSKGYVDVAIRLRLLLALAYQQQHQLDNALTTLAHALTLAQPGGYLRTFLDEGRPLGDLLILAHQRGVAPEYTKKLLAAFATEKQTDVASTVKESSAAPTLYSSAMLSEPLTDREGQVLQQMALGLSNQEIAEKLVVSINTVRTHIKNINGKLNARSRIYAVETARRLGLIQRG